MNRRDFIVHCATIGALPFTKSSWAAPATAAPVSDDAIANSPGKGLILFAQGHSLFLQSPDGSAPREIPVSLPETALDANIVEMVSLTDDAKHIAFRAAGAIYRADVDGSGLKLLASKDGTQLSCPSISPDGNWVACGHDRIHHPLTILSETGEKRPLGKSTLEAYRNRFSRDGKTLFFSASPDLKRVPAEGGEAVTILRGHYIESFDVGPDGRLIAAIPWDNTLSRLGIIDADGNKEYLPPKADEYYAPTWSPDGKFIAFTKKPRYGSSTARGIYLLALADGSITQISDRTFNPTSGLMWR